MIEPKESKAINPDELHDLFEAPLTSPGEEDPFAEMRNNPNYTALIKDLEAIVHAAKELFAPAQEAPPDELWSKIAKQLPTRPEAE